MLNTNTGSIITHFYPTADYTVSQIGSEIVLDWRDTTVPRPTDEEILALELPWAKARQHEARKSALESARNAGFVFLGHTVDSDLESRIMIQGAVTSAQLAQANSATDAEFAVSINGGWRAADGTVVVDTIIGMIQLGLALAQHIAHCDAVSQQHKVEIEAAESVEAVFAVDVTSGY
jgi:hypothetical protein